MKKIYFSLITIAILLFGACTNDGPVNEEPVNKGTLTATISFEGKTRAGEHPSNAQPVVSWNNVSQVQLFLYDGTTGAIRFSRILKPGEAVDPAAVNARTFLIPNVPLGTYKLALLANASMAANKVTTSLNGTTWGIEFNNLNVIGQNIGDILVSVVPKDLPDIPSSELGGWAPGKVGYDAPSEIFTALLPDVVNITEGAAEQVAVPALKREIAMMRTRFDIETVRYPEEAEQRTWVNFDHDRSFIVVQRLPEYFSLIDGISTNVNSDKIFVAAKGVGTYKNANPASGYDPSVIINGPYKRWNDLHVFPNAAGRNGTDITDRQYFIIISAWVNVPAGKTYVSADGKVTTTSQPVYWWALVNDVFTRNVIREVNLTLKTPGYFEFPDEPTGQGSLEIEIGAPEKWDPIIVSTDMDI